MIFLSAGGGQENMISENHLLIEKKRLKDEVVDFLVDSIFSDGLKPGEKLVETRIARLLNVSQGVVREAFQELRSRGFLESIPYKGTFIRAFTDEGLKDYYKVRTEIEMIAVKWSSKLPKDPDNTAFMMKCLEVIKNYKPEEDPSPTSKADLDFHRAIIRRARSPMLLGAWESLNHDFWFSYGIHMESKKYMVIDRQPELHASLLDLLEKKAIEDFRERLEEHFINPFSTLRDEIQP